MHSEIYMELIKEVITKAFAVDSIWSVVFRGVIWFVIALVILISVDHPDSDKSIKNLKSNLGFFLMFLMLSGGLVYLLFGFSSKG